MTLDSALRFLAEIHTHEHADDSKIGFVVMMGASPEPWHKERYLIAWDTVRRHLGMPTFPHLDKAG